LLVAVLRQLTEWLNLVSLHTALSVVVIYIPHIRKSMNLVIKFSGKNKFSDSIIIVFHKW
jgi:hypothetical protein